MTRISAISRRVQHIEDMLGDLTDAIAFVHQLKPRGASRLVAARADLLDLYIDAVVEYAAVRSANPPKRAKEGSKKRSAKP